MPVMYHLIQFRHNLSLDVEVVPRQPFQRKRAIEGTWLRVRLRPYVVETRFGPIWVADFCFSDGTTARGVPFEWFSFAA
jgi:hypothetical protein